MRDDTPAANRDLAAEAAVLGAMMMIPACLPDILAAVNGPDFYDPRHEVVFEAIRELHEESEPTGAVTVARRLLRDGELNRIGGHPYLHELINLAPVSGVALKHARIIRACAGLRRLGAVGTRLAQMGNDGATDPDDIPELLLAAIRALEGELTDTDATATPAVADLLDDVIHGIEHPEKSPVITTGLPDLDDLYPGHAPGNLIVIGARPAVGKSVLGLTFARNAANNGVPTLLISLEMSTREVMHRLLAAEAAVPLDHIAKGACSDYDWERLAAATARVIDTPLYIDDTPNLGLPQIRHKVATLKRRNGIGLLVVDYLQLMAAPPAENRQQQVSALSRGLKLMAKEFQIPVIALAQLNRDVERRHDKRPVSADLRESGALENDADSIILMHREELYGNEARAGECDLIITKSRHGRPGDVVVSFHGHYARCVSYAREWTPHSAMRGAA
jgi:replicative DNA helicase